MGQPAILLGIPVAELNLEPRPVEVQNLFALERGVGGEEQLVLFVRHDPDDKPHLAFECFGVSQQRVGPARQPVYSGGSHP